MRSSISSTLMARIVRSRLIAYSVHPQIILQCRVRLSPVRVNQDSYLNGGYQGIADVCTLTRWLVRE